MKYCEVKKGIFIKREKRFIGYVDVDGEVQTVHVKQTGRCEELLIPGVTVFIERASNPNRKTKFNLISVVKPNGRLINIDSQVPNKVFFEALQNGLELPGFPRPYLITAESTYGDSRLDFKLESSINDEVDRNKKRTAYIEVKGATLEENGIVMFPDAPTIRGLKHVNELVLAKEAGYESYIVFIIQMNDIKYFTPNMRTHPEFGYALKIAAEKGVHILAFDSHITKDSIMMGDPIPVNLDPVK